MKQDKEKEKAVFFSNSVSGATSVQKVASHSYRSHADAEVGFEVVGEEKKKEKEKEKERERESGDASTWIDRCFPSWLRPFAALARLDKSIGTWLLLWPCMWSVAVAAPHRSLPDFKILTLFGVWAIFWRGAACTVNDFFDRDIDSMVERTKLRPLASKELTPFQGLTFLGLQVLMGLGILLQLNKFSMVLGAASLFLLVTYPLMKRWTYWPQAYLGLTFNWGALLGWAAIHGSLDLSVVLPLYLAGFCWTMVYDTIYAHQDKNDDVKVGVKSTALLFGDRTALWLSGFSAMLLASLSLVGLNMNLGWPFYLFILAGGGHLYWQVFTAQLDSPSDCNAKFNSNKWFGALVFAGIVFGKLA